MIAVLKYNSGNLHSVQSAISKLNYQSVITDDPELILKADHVIFPGVGEASSTMKNLQENGLDILIPSLKQPVLGICLGMQLMCRFSEEGSTKALGIYRTEVKKFPAKNIVPHMGWNEIYLRNSPIFKDIEENCNVYFVHSYYAEMGEDSIATTDYILPFSSALEKDNFFGVQFHPEKSGKTGLKILANFLKL